MTIETKISANGSATIYVDGKKTTNDKAFAIAWDNGLPIYDASCHTYTGNFISKSFASPISAYRWLLSKANTNNNFADGSWEIQEVDKINGRRTTIYESMERAFAVNNTELEAYILTLDNADTEEIKAIIAKAAKYVKEESYKLTPEYAREQEERAAKAKAEAEREAIWNASKYLAEKIALDSKSVNDNFEFCIYNFIGKEVQYALADSDDDNTDVFDMIPDTDELNDVDTDDEAKTDEPQDYIFSKTLVSSGYSAHNNAHYSKLERIDKECKILGNSEQTNGSIYREVAFYNADHAHSWAVKTADGKVIISGKDKPDFDKIVAAVNNAEAKAADNISDINEPCHETATVDEPAAIAKFKVGHFYKGDQKYGNKTLEIKIRVTGRTDKTIFYVTRDDQDYEFKSKIKLDGKTEFISDTGGRFAKAADEVPKPVNNGDTPSPENKEDTSMTNTKPTATTDEIREACMEAQTQLETKIAEGAPESDCINDDADKIIADAIELLTVVDKDGNEIKPTTPLMSAEMNAAIDRLVAEFDREQAEAQKPLSLADLKAKYDASEDEAERVAIAINAYRKFLEPEKIKQERQISEQVCASLTADAPQGWAVTFTDKGNYEVTAHGLSAATLDTITAGDFLNPKEFFAKFNRTQADIDNERETAIAELKNQREQLLNMRAELVRDFPNEKERLKILDDMLAENDADITALESLIRKIGMFDDKHFNEDKLPF